MNQIMIWGTNSGSGKSTFARLLGKKLNIEPVHLDSIAWKPGWVSAPDEEIQAKISEVLARERWILEGSYSRHLFDERLRRADTIFFFDVNRFVCFYNAVKRRFQYHNKTRPDMGEGCPEKFDWEFAWWILWQAPASRKRKRAVLQNLPGKNVFIIQNRKQANAFLTKESNFNHELD